MSPTSKSNDGIKKLFHLTALLFIYATFITHTFAASQKAPNFTLPSLGNGVIKLSSFKNQVVYLDFWASWCIPCRKSFPWMQQMHQRYKQQGLVVIAINLDQERELANTFLTDYPSNFIIAFDEKGITPTQYQVMGMPSAYLINKQGKIISNHIGFNHDKKTHYEAAIKRALSE